MDLPFPDTPPNFLASYVQARNSGIVDRLQQTRQNALSKVSTDPDAARVGLMQVGDFNGANALDSYKTGQDQKAILSQYAKDPAAAHNAAYATGDPGIVDMVSKLDENQRQVALEKAQRLAAVAFKLKQTPYEQRKPALQQLAPALQGAYGFTPEQIAAFDPSDATLDGIISQGMDLKTLIEQSKPVSVPEGGRLVNPATGKDIASSPKLMSVTNADGTTSIVSVGGQGGTSAGQGAPPAVRQGSSLSPQITAQISQTAAQSGASPGEQQYLSRLAEVESGGDPNARNGSSTGLFQLHPDTFQSVGGGNINDPGDQVRAALALARKNAPALQQMGVPADAANLYIMHQQGPAGGRALLTAPPEVNAITALAPAYNGNEAIARQAIVNNGGTPDMTAGQFVQMWRERWGGAGGNRTGAGPSVPGPTGSPGGSVVASGSQGDAEALTPEAIDYMAQQYVLTGQLPSVGMGKQGVQDRRKVVNRAQQIEAETGATGADAVTRHLTLKATGQALNQITKTRAMVRNFEQTALANADLMLSLAPKGGGQTGMPVVNRWLQVGRKQVAGDADVSNFDIALGTFADEYAKIVSGSTGGQGSTDASRREAYDRLSKYATQGQLAGGIATMKKEMANRVSSLDAEESGLRETIRRGGKEPPADTSGTPSSADQAGQATFAQHQAAARFLGSTAARGSQGNPLLPATQAQFEKMPNGTWFINPADGQVLQKHH
jgi:hypothetical protein